MRLENLSLLLVGGEVQQLPGAKQAPGDFAGVMQALLAGMVMPVGEGNGVACPVPQSDGQELLPDAATGVWGIPARINREIVGPMGNWPSSAQEYGGVFTLPTVPAGSGWITGNPLQVPGSGVLSGAGYGSGNEFAPADTNINGSPVVHLVKPGDVENNVIVPSIPGTGFMSEAIASGTVEEGRPADSAVNPLSGSVESSGVPAQASIKAEVRFPSGRVIDPGSTAAHLVVAQQFAGTKQPGDYHAPGGVLPAYDRLVIASNGSPEAVRVEYNLPGLRETRPVNLPVAAPGGVEIAGDKLPAPRNVSETTAFDTAGQTKVRPVHPASSVLLAGPDRTEAGTGQGSGIRPVAPPLSSEPAAGTEQSFPELTGRTAVGAADDQISAQQFTGLQRLGNVHHNSPVPIRLVNINELVPLLQSQLPVWAARATAGRGVTAQLKLHPAGLGELQVEVQLSGQQTSVHFVASSAEVKDMLQAALPQLREALQQHNLQLTGASVTLADGQSGLAHQFAGHYGAGGGQRQSGSQLAAPVNREEQQEEKRQQALRSGLDRLV
ncbi:MAG: flagellar hook-length control protein FliK [Bacillota bacterium]